jgi:hypothetical protein
LNLALDGLDGKRHAPVALSTGLTRYQFYTCLSGTQGRSRRVRKMSPPQRFDHRTVHPVASTDYVIPTNFGVKTRSLITIKHTFLTSWLSHYRWSHHKRPVSERCPLFHKKKKLSQRPSSSAPNACKLQDNYISQAAPLK